MNRKAVSVMLSLSMAAGLLAGVPMTAGAEEVQEMLDFDRLDSEHLGKHSLGKLTHDITKELDQLYKMNNHS